MELNGVGVHSGQKIRLILKPSESGRIQFIRRDKGAKCIEIDPKKTKANFCTGIFDNELKVLTIEHLMAALFVFGLDSLRIELDGEEIPIMDGSAMPFVSALGEAGVKELHEDKKQIRITHPFQIRDGEASVGASPTSGLRISYRISYDHPSIGEQEISLAIDQDSFVQAIAPARTFGFLDDVPILKARGLARGGSLENAVVLDEKGVINGPLRFPDEFVRHKVLDFLGDLSLFGAAIHGHFEADKAGHVLHRRCVRFLVDHPDHWEPV